MISLSAGTSRHSDDGRSSGGAVGGMRWGCPLVVRVIQPQMLPIGRTGGELCASCLELLRASMSEQRVQ